MREGCPNEFGQPSFYSGGVVYFKTWGREGSRTRRKNFPAPESGTTTGGVVADRSPELESSSDQRV
jgi:hypothetical protein